MCTVAIYFAFTEEKEMGRTLLEGGGDKVSPMPLLDTPLLRVTT